MILPSQKDRILEDLSQSCSFLEALASFSNFFSGAGFAENAFTRTNASLLLIFIMLFYGFESCGSCTVP